MIFSAQKYHYHAKEAIKPLFDEARSYHAFPGGCVTIGGRDKAYLSSCFGWHTYSKKKRDNKKNLFDLASLTKVIATTTAVMLLLDENKIALNDKVVDYLPEFLGPNQQQSAIKAGITIKHLLTHTSGLPPDNYVKTFDKMYRTPVVLYPGEQQIYSDINFVILAKIVEHITHQPFEVFTRDNIFKPLAMHDTLFKPDVKRRTRAVPTEYIYDRNDFLQGVVNDPTARHLGGVAGNAGLFSTLDDLSHFARMMLNEGRYQGKQIIKPETIRLFTERQTLVQSSSRALGWDTAYPPHAILPTSARGHLAYSYAAIAKYYASPHQFSAGRYIEPSGFGHTGYTGVSLWVSPKYGLYTIVLTNRQFPILTALRRPATYYWHQRIVSALWKNLGFKRLNQLFSLGKPSSSLKQSYAWNSYFEAI